MSAKHSQILLDASQRDYLLSLISSGELRRRSRMLCANLDSKLTIKLALPVISLTSVSKIQNARDATC